ncbi:MAG: class I SAM-dependent methyltransferase [Alicyclobacillus sp.]|nr:class I SAM-dependent methyltransferase [Alicyclobacillus sp.]
MDYHDVLAAIGAGSAHPGGMKSTKLWMDALPWHEGMEVLEVGCGTGRTLLELQRITGCHATGVDIRPTMIQKARKRAKAMRQQVTWKEASAEHLPFHDEQFDVVITESVNVFVRADRAIREYWRVLKNGGRYVDVEMMMLGPVSEEWKQSVKEVYGVQMVPDLAGWRRLYQDAGFSQIQVLGSWPVRPEESLTIDGNYPDPVDLSSPGVYQDARVRVMLKANADWLESHHKSLAYVICVCTK